MEIKPERSKIIVVTGPESTGKTALAKSLSLHYNVSWIPEISRSYIENLDSSYTYAHVEQIAKMQIKQFEEALASNEKCIFDTGLIITKVWFSVVYNKYPSWLLDAIDSLPKFVHLLCATDLPWLADSVRENGGEMREKLFSTYKSELETNLFPYYIIDGIGDKRLTNAIAKLDSIW